MVSVTLERKCSLGKDVTIRCSSSRGCILMTGLRLHVPFLFPCYQGLGSVFLESVMCVT